MDHASRGAHYADAEFFQVSPESVTIDMVKSFWLPDLTTQYECWRHYNDISTAFHDNVCTFNLKVTKL